MSHVDEAFHNLTAAFPVKLAPELRRLVAAIILDDPSTVDTGITPATVDSIVEAIGIGVRQGFAALEPTVTLQEPPGGGRTN
jgi:hypothetical protein